MNVKLNILISLILLSLSFEAFCSKARLEAMGQPSNAGSSYIPDSRNVFGNSAYINLYKNYIITEWGTPNDTDDSPTSPHAEGGFFKEEGSFIYGLYLGNEGYTRNVARASDPSKPQTTGDDDFLMHDNPIDFFFGGDAGILWGLRAHYAGSSDNSGAFEKTHKAYGFGIGAILNNIEYFANTTLADISEGATLDGDKWESELGFTTGVNYIFESVNLFVEYSKNGYTYQSSSGKLIEHAEDYKCGLGKIYDITKTSKLFLDLYYLRSDEKFSIASTSKSKIVTVPITFAFEAETYDWLTLRGAVSQNIHGDQGERNIENSTVVTAGGTLKFKQVEFDGLIGTTGTAAGRAPTATNNSSGILSTDNLMTRISLKFVF